jgi:hypothetical protein
MCCGECLHWERLSAEFLQSREGYCTLPIPMAAMGEGLERFVDRNCSQALDCPHFVWRDTECYE